MKDIRKDNQRKIDSGQEKQIGIGSFDPSAWEPYQLPEDWYQHEEDFYFPINIPQVNTLLGKLLTHIEAMNLPSSAEKANKDLVRQSLWSWFGEVQENSMTSYRNCIAPIELPKTPENRIV